MEIKYLYIQIACNTRKTDLNLEEAHCCWSIRTNVSHAIRKKTVCFLLSCFFLLKISISIMPRASQLDQILLPIFHQWSFPAPKNLNVQWKDRIAHFSFFLVFKESVGFHFMFKFMQSRFNCLSLTLGNVSNTGCYLKQFKVHIFHISTFQLNINALKRINSSIQKTWLSSQDLGNWRSNKPSFLFWFFIIIFSIGLHNPKWCWENT